MTPETQTLSEAINAVLGTINTELYSKYLIALLIGTGLYFFIRTKALPLRMFKESMRVVSEPPDEPGNI